MSSSSFRESFRALVRLVGTVGAPWACLCATAMLLLAGCERQIAPPLLEVTELTPREVETGDRLEVHGVGFPQGRIGQVTFQGTVYRPGEPPHHRVSIEADGAVATPDRLDLSIRDALAERFCGRGDAAVHATFRGDVHVSFASSTPGAPPLVGKLRDASIDVLAPSVRASIEEKRVLEGGRVLAYLGVVAGARSARGLPIERVRPGSPADRSGMLVGDVIAAVDGVHVLSAADVVPASARASDITIRHAESGAEEVKSVSLIGYSSERVPTEYAPALVVVGLAFALLFFLVLPGPPRLAALEMRLASLVRRTSARALWSRLSGRGSAAALTVLVTAFIAALALTPHVLGRDIDGVMLLASATTMLVWSRVAAERGFFASARTTLLLGAAALVMAASAAIAVLQIGALGLAELVHVQGGAPWQFAAARHPACALLAGVYAVALVALLRVRPSAPAAAAAAASSSSSPTRSSLLERAGLLLAASLGVALFFGGWQLPGLPDPRGNLLRLLAGAVFVLKTWTFAAALFGASRVSSSHGPRDVALIVGKRLVPSLAIASLLVAGSRQLVPSAALESAFGATIVALGVLLVVRVVARVRAAVLRPEPHASPFL